MELDQAHLTNQPVVLKKEHVLALVREHKVSTGDLLPAIMIRWSWIRLISATNLSFVTRKTETESREDKEKSASG